MTSVACRTLISLFICLITCARMFGSTSTMIVMRESVGIERTRDRQAFDVVSALAEQSGDTHQRAGLVFHKKRNNLLHCIRPAYTSTGCGGPSTISLIAPPAGTIGYTFSNGVTFTFSR